MLLFVAAPLLFTIPAVPAHDSSIQWDVDCFDTSPTTSDLTLLHTRTRSDQVGELHVSEDLLLASNRADGGFGIYSLADPAAPSLVRNFRGLYNLDMKTSMDGDVAYVGSFDRIQVVNIANPSGPYTVRYVALPGLDEDQAHMLHVNTIGGKEHVFAASQTGTGVYIYEATGTAGQRDLVLRNIFAPGSPLAAHDMYVHHDPVLGRPILYVANGFAGWIAADVSDPANPVPMAVVPNPDLGQSYVHTVQVQWIEGRRLVTTIAEVGANILRVWDATVLSAPILLAEWSSQSDVGIVPSVTSQHNIQMVDGRLFMAHYRCGFWVFDLRTLPTLPVFTAIQPVAHFAPTHGNGQHWDVVLKDGYIYTSDMNMGNDGRILTVRYDAMALGDPAFTSTG